VKGIRWTVKSILQALTRLHLEQNHEGENESH